MAPLSLRISLQEGTVCRTILFQTNTTVAEAQEIVLEKFHGLNHDKEYGLFLRSTDDDKSGIWLESHRHLDYYMLRDGDLLQYLCKIRNLRVRLLDGSVKTFQVDESKEIGELLLQICSKIGITNYDEYGFCREQDETSEEPKPTTGTLTLKRKMQREKDVELEQLSKKLKTDDNVEWFNQKSTLRDLKVDPNETLLFKRRLFYSDRKIDSRDPVQLNLLYVQTRDNILSGRQVTAEDKAVELAGIQCQVHFGDFEEDKHKPGFIENLAEYLPEQYVSSWGIEKKIYREYRKHSGISQLDAKYLYTKMARDHPTYGVTFFLVKEQEKSKKKLVPRLLGINSNSILRLDEKTKEIQTEWRLTQVKRYHAGKSTFTLNFGDYSYKEYTVKTNEAYRIRDILEGYIDIIRKKMEAPVKVSYVEGQMICEDNVEMSRSNVIQTIAAQKLVEQSFVGPSKIISHEFGQEAQHGTQIVTVQQMIITKKGDMKQQALSSTPADFGRRLNNFNSQSVKAVMLLGDPSQRNINQLRTIAEEFESDLPELGQGVQVLATHQTSEEDKKKLLDDLEQIQKYVETFSSSTKRNDLESPENLEKAEDAAKKIAELSSLLILSSDPKIRRRSELLRRSRKSFIADERVEATLRRASFLAVLSSACKSVEHGLEDINKPYDGPPVDKEDAMKLKSSAADKLGKLNAAVALLLAARADPKNVDFETAVNSMTTINELTPSLIEDCKALGSIQDEDKRKDLMNQLHDLCQGLNTLCALTGSNEETDIQDVANKYAKSSGKLIYVFNPKGKSKSGNDPEKANEIVELAKKVRDKTSNILVLTSDLTKAAVSDPRAEAVDEAAVKSADAALGLLTCSQITAPTIREPRCQSALTAAVENCSSSAEQLTLAWKPLVAEEKFHKHGKQLDDKTSKLMKTLERLRKAYGDLDEGVQKPAVLPKPDTKPKDKKRLHFITTLSAAKHSVEEVERELQDINKHQEGKAIIDEDNNKDRLRQLLAQKIAQLNAATATLVQAISDRDNPDYDTAAAALNVVNELNSGIIKDTKSLCPYEDEKTRKDMLEEIAALCKATRNICACLEGSDFKDLHDAASNFAESSGKLCYVFNPRTNPDSENKILDLSRSACEKASEMLSKVYQLAEAVGGEDGAQLDSSGAKVVTAAQGLLTVAQLTAPSITDKRCQSTIITSADNVSNLTQEVASIWEPIIKNPKYQFIGEQICRDRESLEATLEKLKNASRLDSEVPKLTDASKGKDKGRLNFIMTMSAAKRGLADADKLLIDSNDSAVTTHNLNKDTPAYRDLQRLTAQKLADLNAAIAALVRATADVSNVDYDTAETALAAISQITPELIQNTNELSQYADQKQRRLMLDNVRSLCKANKLIFDSMEKNDIQELNNAANKFVTSSGKLCYVFNPRANSMKENQILDLSREACEGTSQMLSRVYELAQNIGGEQGSLLDTSGAKVVDAAQVLLTTAQITAASITDDGCRSELISAADNVSGLTQNLATLWEPVIKDPNHQAIGKQINADRKQLDAVLEKLKNACRIDKDVVKKPENVNNMREKQRLNFIKSATGTKEKLSEVGRILQDNCDSVMRTAKLNKDTAEYRELQHLSAQKLAELNAAIAALVRATSDSENPDYQTAETTLTTISQLTPQIVQNTGKLCEYENEQERRAMVETVRALCAANERICDSIENNDVKELSRTVGEMAKSSGKLYYVYNPRAKPKVENKIIDLSKVAHNKASDMLSCIQELKDNSDGEHTDKLEKSGSRLAQAAENLLTTALLTAPAIMDGQCQSTLITSADAVSNLSREVASHCEPTIKNPKYQYLGEKINKNRESLEATLEKLKNACELDNEFVKETDDTKAKEKRLLNFTKTTSMVRKNLAEAEKLLLDSNNISTTTHKFNKGTPAHKDLQRLTAQKLTALNAAIAALVRATSDDSNLDYDVAESSLAAISQLTPEIILNTNELSQYEDEKQGRVMLDNVRSLCMANKQICESMETNDVQELINATNKFIPASGKLCYVFNPRANAVRENQIVSISKEVCEVTSVMLSRVYELAENIGGEQGSLLDTSGAKVVDAAQVLLTTAQITAASIADDGCRAELVSAADTVSNLTEKLSSIWEPIVRDPSRQGLGKQICEDRTQLNAVLEKLRNACRTDEDDSKTLDDKDNAGEMKRLKITKDMSELNKDAPENRNLLKLSAQKLVDLNAAIAGRRRPSDDTGNLRKYKNERERRAAMENIRALCAADKHVYDSIDNSGVKIIELSKAANKKVSDMLSCIQQLKDNIGGEDAERLEKSVTRLVEAAENLLSTAVKTAPSLKEDHCQSQQMASIELVSDLAGQLALLWEPMVQQPPVTENQAIGDKLNEDYFTLGTMLDQLRNVTNPNSDLVKLMKSVSDAREKLGEAEKHLQDSSKNNIMTAKKPNKDSPEYKDLQNRSAQKLAELNAAIAALVRATADTTHPDYKAREKDVVKISLLTPEVVKYSKNASEYMEPKQREAILENVRELCKANQLVYDSVEKNDKKMLTDAANKFANCSDKLCYTFNPRAKTAKENLIMGLSKSAGEKSSELLTVVCQLADSVGDKVGAELDMEVAKVADSAMDLITISHVTAPSIDNAECQGELVATAQKLSSDIKNLSSKWAPVVKNSRYAVIGQQLNESKKEVNTMIEKLVAECKAKHAVSSKPQRPDPPARISSYLPEEDKRKNKHVHFCNTVDNAQHTINKAKEDLKTPHDQPSTRPLIVGAQEKLQNLIVENLALVGVAVSQLISDMGSDHVNYESAIKATKVLAEILPVIVRDGKELSCEKGDMAKDEFLADMMSLCDVTTKLCDTAKNNTKDVNDVAVEFGNKAAKLLYSVSAEAHPGQEKEVIRRAREIGDSASRLAVRGAKGAVDLKDARAHAICAAATRCADSASDFMYTAKLLAPTIHKAESQKALLEVSNQLSSKAKEFFISWQPLNANEAHAAFVKDLDTESDLLKNLLEDFNQDLKKEKFVKRRVLEKLVIEDTPLRQLASNILENIKAKAATSDSAEEKKHLKDYTDKLAAAIRDMDVANAKCRNIPQDIKRREELEEAVQHLQQTCLESRIQSGDEKRFVDLMDLITQVSSDAEKLSEETMSIKPEFNKYALITIKSQADDIVKDAAEAAHPQAHDGEGVIDDTAIIKRFAQKCDERVDVMRVAIEEIRDAPSKATMHNRLMDLKQSSDILRFAVNSHIAAVRSAALDANQADFENLEKNVDKVLHSTRTKKKLTDEPAQEAVSATMATATTLCSAVSSQRAAEKIPPALTAYLLEMRSATDISDPKQKLNLEEHLKKLLHLLKTHTMASTRQIATWQEADQGEVAEITRQIIQEIENFSKDENEGGGKRISGQFLDQCDSKKLLLPPTELVYGNEKDVNKQFDQLISKLSSLTGAVSGVSSREAPRTLRAVADTAAELNAVARSIASANPLKRAWIEEMTDAMCSTTYHLLKTAEVASKDPHNPTSLRRVHEACRLTNESINKLGQVTRSKDRLKRDCNEVAFNLQLQTGLLQTDYPSNMMSYSACLQPLQNQNNLHSIQNEDPMNREECGSNLHYIGSMVCHSSELAAQCGYLLSLPDEYQFVAKEGFVNVSRILNISGELRIACLKIMRCTEIEEANYTQSQINKQVLELQEVIEDAVAKLKDPQSKRSMLEGFQEVDNTAKDLRENLRKNPEMQAVIPFASRLLDAVEDFTLTTSRAAVIPHVKPSADRKARSEQVIGHAKTLISKTQDLVQAVNSSPLEVLTWSMFAKNRTDLLTTYQQFVRNIEENGCRAGFIEGEVKQIKQEETKVSNEPKKSYIQTQVDLANKWLSKPVCKPDDKVAGIQGVKNIIQVAEKMSREMKGDEKSDVLSMINETTGLLEDCSTKYNSEKASLLLERLRELHTMLTWRVVTMVVEDFLEDEPLMDLDMLTDGENDHKKRKYVLDKKIAGLLAQLGKVTKTARYVAETGTVASDQELLETSDQVELLAPSLVKAAQHRIENPGNKEAVETYKRCLAEYSLSMSKLREICDLSVDPMEFAQAAGETIQRIREESTVKNDPQTCAFTSKAITRLGLRVIEAGLSSREAQSDPQLKQALAQARGRLAAASRPQRASRMPDWHDITAEILRTTGEVESFLGGENIFQKQPEPDQPIYAAALDLHATVREWSARDNEIVAVAKRMAVQMARISDYMNSERKCELLTTSKDIVASSRQVAALARKLALECTDMRIRTNLMQVCERIPTISGQLKMLITVKGSTMGNQGSQENREAMDTLVSNAQNLMSSVQEVVKAAIGASVKIMSQRGLRMKWVRRACYNY